MTVSKTGTATKQPEKISTGTKQTQKNWSNTYTRNDNADKETKPTTYNVQATEKNNETQTHPSGGSGGSYPDTTIFPTAKPDSASDTVSLTSPAADATKTDTAGAASTDTAASGTTSISGIDPNLLKVDPIMTPTAGLISNDALAEASKETGTDITNLGTSGTATPTGAGIIGTSTATPTATTTGGTATTPTATTPATGTPYMGMKSDGSSLSLDDGLKKSQDFLKTLDKDGNGVVDLNEAKGIDKNINPRDLDINGDKLISSGENLALNVYKDESIDKAPDGVTPKPDGTITDQENKAVDDFYKNDKSSVDHGKIFRSALDKIYKTQGGNDSPSIAQRDTGANLASTTAVNPTDSANELNKRYENGPRPRPNPFGDSRNGFGPRGGFQNNGFEPNGRMDGRSNNRYPGQGNGNRQGGGQMFQNFGNIINMFRSILSRLFPNLQNQ